MQTINKKSWAKRELTGKKFGRLTVLKKTEKRRGTEVLWTCQCDCGTIKDVGADCLSRGQSKSCGCLCIDRSKETNTTHGKKKSRAYSTWTTMKQRCLNPKSKNFKSYGEKGITICNEWKIFENFYKDMGDPPVGLSIDRINNYGNYCKENCRWATPKQQCSNRKNDKKFNFKGEDLNLYDLWKKYLKDKGINCSTLYRRLEKGESLESALTRDSEPGKPIIKRVCLICGLKNKGHGLCSRHHKNFIETGNPLSKKEQDLGMYFDCSNIKKRWVGKVNKKKNKEHQTTC